ncbi:putative phospholipase B-like 2 [Halichondria panicea]|uniref:putative phospholipase B-like 2 n=1 Tax=Halichondria panicea TaxID=6063 RepID=UPI00312BB620
MYHHHHPQQQHAMCTRKPHLFTVSLLLSLLLVGQSVEVRQLSAIRKGPWHHEIVEGPHPDAVVSATFNNTINLTGWATLEIVDLRSPDSPQKMLDQEVAYVAGLMEGNLTGPLMLMQWKNTMANYCTDNPELCSKIDDFIVKNNDFTQKLDSDDPYWHQIYLFALQIMGLMDGYGDLDIEQLPDFSFIFFQLHGDLNDLESALGGGNKSYSHVLGSGSCSALIKPLPDHSDILIGHDTWTSYYNMLRIYKLYDFKFHMSHSDKRLIPGHRQSFSSYPGRLYSGDDFYVLGSGLVTMETSIENFNPDLWKFVTPESVFENYRVVAANRLASSGKEWTSIFSKYNSGTYNNQWMVVDYKLFQPGAKDLKEGLLWVLEQLPNKTVAFDKTDMLIKQEYWASYNIPFYPSIYQMSGTAEMAAKYGDWFDWYHCPRAKIFSRNHSDVTDLDSMVDLMRYNNFQHDPLSSCKCTPPYSAENGIAARSDLNPADGTYPLPALGHRAHGAIDMKVTNYKMFQSHSCMASSGPTFEEQPPFQWSKSGFTPVPLGHPDVWNFKPVHVSWNS